MNISRKRNVLTCIHSVSQNVWSVLFFFSFCILINQCPSFLSCLSVYFVCSSCYCRCHISDTQTQAHTPFVRTICLEHSSQPRSSFGATQTAHGDLWAAGSAPEKAVRGHTVSWTAKIDASSLLPHWVDFSLSTQSCHCKASAESRSLNLLGEFLKRPWLFEFFCSSLLCPYWV